MKTYPDTPTLFEPFLRGWIYSVCVLTSFVNMAGFLSYAYSVSHYTGNFITLLQKSITGEYRVALELGVMLLCFLWGAMMAAWVNRNGAFRIQGKYGEAQLVMGILLACAYQWILNRFYFVLFLCVGMGFQNGLIRTYRGVSLRPSHVTSTLTDIGLYLGDYMIGIVEASWKITFSVHLLLSFGVGIVGAVALYPYVRDQIFWMAAGGYILLGLLYFLLRALYLRRLRHEVARVSPPDPSASAVE
ncbi:MAG: YoaK family protein [Alistipes sp.]|nr:YoaK family protein [Alistipes sp.]